jgi:hypothetical protein
VVLDTPLAAISPEEPLNVPEPAAHAEGEPPEEQPAKDNETMKSVATAVPTTRHCLNCTAITSFAQFWLRSVSHFLTCSRSSLVLARETMTPGLPVTTGAASVTYAERVEDRSTCGNSWCHRYRRRYVDGPSISGLVAVMIE